MSNSEQPKDPAAGKSELARREEEILAFWQRENIFEKTLEQTRGGEEFVFYEGPPTANGRPGIHHLEARAFKDAIPRYKTMRGYHVRRKGGWDTHGLPVELEVEKQLGLRSKKEIEEYGIERFNEQCRESVWTYVNEWREFTERIGFWVDLDNPYVTYYPDYMESLWHILGKAQERGLLYKDYKVLPWCTRCGTALSSHELAQGYETVKDLSVTVGLEVVSTEAEALSSEVRTILLTWTTTPWTLPGNVALAVGANIQYIVIEKEDEDGSGKVRFVLAQDRLESVFEAGSYEIVAEVKGKDLVGTIYEPLYPYLKDNLPKSEQSKLKKAFQIYEADFVTTEEGTGIVHTAVMYGQDDFELGSRVGLPKFHLVNADGTFISEADFLAGRFAKDEDTEVAIIKDLAARGRLFDKKKIEHTYPFCWRCKTPLLYYARESWYLRMSELREELITENQEINWEPDYIRDGRFGEWLSEVKDWAISRERYWGTPLPVWTDESGEVREVISSREELLNKAPEKLTKAFFVRHGESEKNVKHIYDSSRDTYGLTDRGREQAARAAEAMREEGVDLIYTSPVRRARETAEIIGQELNCEVREAEELWEVDSGEWDGVNEDAPAIAEAKRAYYELAPEEQYRTPRGQTGESWQAIEERAAPFVKQAIAKHPQKVVAFVTHQGTKTFAMRPLKGWSIKEALEHRMWDEDLISHARPTKIFYDRTRQAELDLHRPYVDAITYQKHGVQMKRTPEVMDVWFDSGGMPFAQDHYPFEAREVKARDQAEDKTEDRAEQILYPADFIAEAIDQTRGWFYTLHAVGNIMDRGKAYRNVICLGHILDADGKKMSKSKGNVVDPWRAMDTYGVDALRFWMYSVNQPGEPKNFDESTVDEVVKKVFNLASNTARFYEMYKERDDGSDPERTNILDQWIESYTDKFLREVTNYLDNYKLLEASRVIRGYITDLSQWYLRRSRDRLRDGDQAALSTLRRTLLTLSKVMAPFTPFFAEDLYQRAGGQKESVHLEQWPAGAAKNKEQKANILEEMKQVRQIVSEALELRAQAGIKVRQPLPELKIPIRRQADKILSEELIQIIKDEVNIKEVTAGDSLSIDTELTDELKAEGAVRELIRAVQDQRKKAGLEPGEEAKLIVSTDKAGQELLDRYGADIKKTASLSEISSTDEAPAGGVEAEGNGYKFVFSI